jgi:hypothetical protein
MPSPEILEMMPEDHDRAVLFSTSYQRTSRW